MHTILNILKKPSKKLQNTKERTMSMELTQVAVGIDRQQRRNEVNEGEEVK